MDVLIPECPYAWSLLEAAEKSLNGKHILSFWFGFESWRLG